MLNIDIITLFPEMFKGPFSASIVARAIDAQLVTVEMHQLRDFADDRHHTVDDEPFGGGPGMVLKAEPLLRAVRSVKEQRPDSRIILMSPQGKKLVHSKVRELSQLDSLTLVCGHYEGVDQRFIEAEVDEEISIGDFVLTGGEIPAMALVDAVTRLLPGALGDADSASLDTFAEGLDGLLQGPVYTRPVEVEGVRVPGMLLSGDHARIETWRRQQAVRRTQERRPELLDDWPE